MRVLGIDPSSTLCGLALVVDGDLVDTWTWKKQEGKSGPWNLYDYFTFVMRVADASRPQMAVVESLSVERNAVTARKVSHYQAASVLACKEMGIMTVEARVSSARKEALGRGNMSKDEAFQAIKKMFPKHKFKAKTSGGYDETDATVLAVAGPGIAER